MAACPRQKIAQSTGRILKRLFHIGPKPSAVVCRIDKVPTLRAQSVKRVIHLLGFFLVRAKGGCFQMHGFILPTVRTHNYASSSVSTGFDGRSFNRPDFRSASRNTYSIWALTDRSSSSDQRFMASSTSGLMRSGYDFLAATSRSNRAIRYSPQAGLHGPNREQPIDCWPSPRAVLRRAQPRLCLRALTKPFRPYQPRPQRSFAARQ